MLDPLTALGIAGNVVQFVDFASKLFNESVEVYHSASGSSSSVRTLATVSAELSALSKSFAPEDLKPLGLSDVATQCSDIAKEIQSLVDRLTLKKPSKGLWPNFTVALKTVRSKGQIAVLMGRVDSVQLKLGVQMQKLVV